MTIFSAYYLRVNDHFQKISFLVVFFLFLQNCTFLIALWENSKEVETVKWIQARSSDDSLPPFEADNYASSEDEDQQQQEEESSNSEGDDDEENESSSDGENATAFGNKFSALNVSN